jgi:hypothetical protein
MLLGVPLDIKVRPFSVRSRNGQLSRSLSNPAGVHSLSDLTRGMGTKGPKTHMHRQSWQLMKPKTAVLGSHLRLLADRLRERCLSSNKLFAAVRSLILQRVPPTETVKQMGVTL